MEIGKNLDLAPIRRSEGRKVIDATPPAPTFEHSLLKSAVDGMIERMADKMMFSWRDKDKDGALSAKEYGLSAKRQAEFLRYDTDGDGKVTKEEFEKGRARDRQQAWMEDMRKTLPHEVPKMPGPLSNRIPDLSDLVSKVKSLKESE